MHQLAPRCNNIFHQYLFLLNNQEGFFLADYIQTPQKYPLKIPVDKKDTFYANLDEIPVVSKPKQVFTTHRVRRGETLSIIAEKHRVSVESIVCANSIDRQNYIITGQTLRIPKSAVVYQTQKQKSLKKEPAIKHVVKKGDSLWIIAKRYGTTTQQILEHNHLQSSRLYIGQVLMVPDSESETATNEGLKIYQVRQGDNPFYISKRHSMELERFLRINHLTPKSKIFPGQKLFVE